MSENVFQQLAKRRLRMPIGTDLILHEHPDPESVKHDGRRLGEVVAEAARRYRTPLAFPLMDLTLEKADLLDFFGIPESGRDSFHFDELVSLSVLTEFLRSAGRPFPQRMQANLSAVSYIAGVPGLVPVGMLIGPFSLMTKLVRDPIAPVAMAGRGVTAEEEPLVYLVERCLAMAEATVARSAKAQIAAGARAMIVCEPAANAVYISPRQLRAGSEVFERYVLGPNRRLRDILRERGVDLIFHNCGELTADMVRQFAAELQPAMLSLGSSRKLWEDASALSPDIVLFGNLPTKTFYSDEAMPVSEVRRLAAELTEKMDACGHPHILGSECDVLYVDEAADTIRRKVDVMLGYDEREQ